MIEADLDELTSAEANVICRKKQIFEVQREANSRVRNRPETEGNSLVQVMRPCAHSDVAEHRWISLFPVGVWDFSDGRRAGEVQNPPALSV